MHAEGIIVSLPNCLF